MKTKLSKRELKVLELMQFGFKNNLIAKDLGIDEKTVSTYKSRMKKKLGILREWNDYRTVKIAEYTGIIKELKNADI